MRVPFYSELEEDFYDDDEDEPTTFRTLADFRTRMDSLFDDTNKEEVDKLLRFAVKSPKDKQDALWPRTSHDLQPGTLLVANPTYFSDAHPHNLEQYGLTMAPP